MRVHVKPIAIKLPNKLLDKICALQLLHNPVNRQTNQRFFRETQDIAHTSSCQ